MSGIEEMLYETEEMIETPRGVLKNKKKMWFERIHKRIFFRTDSMIEALEWIDDSGWHPTDKIILASGIGHLYGLIDSGSGFQKVLV